MTRAYAHSKGFILPPLGGQPYEVMTVLSDINKEVFKNLEKMKKPPISEEECKMKGFNIVKEIKRREAFLSLIM